MCFAYVFLTMIFFGCVLWTGVLFVYVGRSSMSTLRMEPQFMMIGHAAGTVAVGLEVLRRTRRTVAESCTVIWPLTVKGSLAMVVRTAVSFYVIQPSVFINLPGTWYVHGKSK